MSAAAEGFHAGGFMPVGQKYTSNSQFCRVLRVIEAFRVGQAPKSNREAGVAEPYMPIENMNEIDR